MKFRRTQPNKQIAYSVIKNFDIKRVNSVNGKQELLLIRKDNERNRGGLVCPLLHVFDAIYCTHYRCAHGKTSQTHKLLQLTYWNINEREVKFFISL
jgi:hypothetical protein